MTGLVISRYFSLSDTHPYDEVEWDRRSLVKKTVGTNSLCECVELEFPVMWSSTASMIVANKYFRSPPLTLHQERSLKALIDRVVGSYAQTGRAAGYFSSEEDAAVFEDELTWLLLNQYFSFNSPVWLNVGTTAPQTVSACFILGVDDSLESILDWYTTEGLIFRQGAGTGTNLSNIRASTELLSSGIQAPGPVAFMRGADAIAATIKSGGVARGNARMITLDVDHPDVLEFVECKEHEEAKAEVLAKAGFSVGMGGHDRSSIQFQNANNAIRVTDKFMEAATTGGEFSLRARNDGQIVGRCDAAALLTKMASAAWSCGDPGIQFSDTIDLWHTNPEAGRITSSNACSEYMGLDNSACNLASINLRKFLTDDGSFDTQAFVAAVKIITLALDISLEFAAFPTPKIEETTRRHRQIGIGYTNLGALLMAAGIGYGSESGRALAASVTSLLSATAYRRSAELAQVLGPYPGYEKDEVGHQAVLRRHIVANESLRSVTERDSRVLSIATEQWVQAERISSQSGFRNSQVSLLAPTGTISLMMDCDTTGIEPDYSLVKTKELVEGGAIEMLDGSIQIGLAALGYATEDVVDIVQYIQKCGSVVGAPHLKQEDYDVFATAVGDYSLSWDAHLQMMAAVQPFLSGAISKTVNLPASATVEDVKDIFITGWQMGLKSLSVYRDTSKLSQPLTARQELPDQKTLRVMGCPNGC